MRSYALRQPLGVGRSLIALATAILLVGLLAAQAFAVSAGTVTIDAGAAYTTDTLVDLTLTNTDATAAQVFISNNGLDWNQVAWSPTNGTQVITGWDLTNATFGGNNYDGTKRVYVHWTDADGIASTKVSDLITLDRAIPSFGSISINAGDVATKSSTVSLKLSAYDRTSGVSKVRLSNSPAGTDGNLPTTNELDYTSNMTVSSWALGGTADGTYTVYAQYVDRVGFLSKVYSDSIKVDNGVPTGTVGMPQINRNATYTKSHIVSVSVSALDPALTDGTAGSGLAKVALSNDGVKYLTVNYTSLIGWNLTNALYGGNSDTGLKHVWVKWTDRAGNESTVLSDDIIYDPVAPTLPSGVSQSLYLNSVLGSTVPVKETWSAATDPALVGMAGSGIARYQVQQKIDTGAWVTVSYPGAAAISLNRLVTPGKVYQFQVRAQDKAGNFSGWVQSKRFKALVYQEAAASITYTGTWTRQYLSYASGLYSKYTISGAAGASFAYNGSDVALVAHKSSLRGVATINTQLVDLYSKTLLPRRVVYSANFDGNDTRSVAVDVAGTSGRPRFDIDAFIVLQEQ